MRREFNFHNKFEERELKRKKALDEFDLYDEDSMLEDATPKVYVFRNNEFGAEYGGEVGELMTVPNEDHNHIYEPLVEAVKNFSNIDSPAELLKEGIINNWFVTDRQTAEKIVQDMIDMDYDGEGNLDSPVSVDEISIEDLFEELKIKKAEDQGVAHSDETGNEFVVFVNRQSREITFESTNAYIGLAGQVDDITANLIIRITDSPDDFVEMKVVDVIGETETTYTLNVILYYLEVYEEQEDADTEAKAEDAGDEDTLKYQVGDIVEVNQYDQKLNAEIIRVAKPDEVNPGLNDPDAGQYYLVRFTGAEVGPYEAIVWEGRLRPVAKAVE